MKHSLLPFIKATPVQIKRWFRFICIGEAWTCFFLYCVAMPLKYSFDLLILMIPAGCIHGIFFTLYLYLCLGARKIYHWDDEDFVFAIGSAFFPFASIWVEKKLARHDREK